MSVKKVPIRKKLKKGRPALIKKALVRQTDLRLVENVPVVSKYKKGNMTRLLLEPLNDWLRSHKI